MVWNKINEFLRDESGGLFSVLGKAVGGFFGGGPLGAAIGGALGQSADDRRADKKARAFNANRYIEMANAARAAGLHPLEVLRSGDPAQRVGPRIGTTAAMQGQFDQIDPYPQQLVL